jgi:predicted RNA-binding protein with PIN domain
MKLEYPMKLSFVLEEENNVLNKVFVVEGDIQWTELIIKFADFLNAHYGYDTKEKIVFLSDYGYNDQWSVVGERTITHAAYKLAKEIDEKQEELDFEE